MLKTRLLTASALVTVSTLATPAFAQADAPTVSSTAPTNAQCASDPGLEGCPQSDDGGQTVTVTGSRIRRPNVESALPVTSIGGEEFFQQASNNVGDTLNDLPQLRSTFAQQNPGLGIGIAGLNLLDLRGLGTARTLVLVNGRRHVASDILSNATAVDVNTIPNDLIERVDVVTGGNSAVYGSDAIAGVVNFVLKRDFDGVQARGNAGVSEQGFGGSQYVSLLGGQNFADGRGNITAHIEYARQERIFGSDIDSFQRVDGLITNDIDTAGLVSNSDGFPDATFGRDIRSASINRFGLVPVTQPIANPRCGTGIAATNGAPGTTAQSLAYNCTYIFGQDGRLVQQTGTRYSSGIIGGILGGNGQTGREGRLLSVLPFQERINANLLAHYTFSPAIEAFFEGKVVRINSLGSNAGPSFIQGTFGQFDYRERTRLDNPFLNPADRTTLANAILASGCNTSLTAACSAARTTSNGIGVGGALNATDIAAINAGTYRFVDSRSLLDSGIRDEKFRRDTYRFVAGLRGTFNDDWSYELSGNYGKFKEITTTFGYVDRQRFLLALDAGRNPITGAIQCRSQFDAASAVAFTQGFTTDQAAAQRARLASDIAACVPYNPFGGANNQASANYFVYNARSVGTIDQLVGSGFVSGDLSQLFELPGGPIRFAVGGEYRREKATYRQDRFILTGATNAVVIPDFLPPAFEVKEAYAEVQVPLLRDTPFFEELSLSGAGRVADYKGGTGTVYAYNGGGEWAPVRDIRFRANYGRAVRAPNVSETGFPIVPNFAPGFSDPCNANNIGQGSTFRVANCTADLGALLGGLPTSVYSLPVLSGSNPNLSAEKSNSLTVGAVIQPRWTPGLSLTIDYYDIDVKGVIVSLAAQAIVNACYDQQTLDNPFCAAFTRYRGAGTGPLGTLPGQVLANSLNQAPLNFAKRTRRGVDIELAYRKTFSENFKFDTRFLLTHQLQNSNFQSATDPTFENRLLSELGDPKNEFRWDVNATTGPLTIGYRMRYIGPMYVGAYEDFNTLQGRPPQNLDASDIRTYRSVLYHNLRFEYQMSGKSLLSDNGGLNLFFGVDNLTKEEPPLGSTGTGAGSSIYNIRGRNYYAGFRARF